MDKLHIMKLSEHPSATQTLSTHGDLTSVVDVENLLAPVPRTDALRVKPELNLVIR